MKHVHSNIGSHFISFLSRNWHSFTTFHYAAEIFILRVLIFDIAFCGALCSNDRCKMQFEARFKIALFLSSLASSKVMAGYDDYQRWFIILVRYFKIILEFSRIRKNEYNDSRKTDILKKIVNFSRS